MIKKSAQDIKREAAEVGSFRQDKKTRHDDNCIFLYMNMHIYVYTYMYI